MAYLPDFENDIFISYAHVDNLVAGGQKGWVAQFFENLEVRLWKRFGRKGAVKIWWDPALDGNQLFDKTIKEAIDRSALFVALTSTGYLESEYCQQEIKWFHEKAKNESMGLAAGDRLRIFNLLLNNISFDKWPGQYDRTSGYPFHDAARDDQFGEPSDPADKLFQQQLRELVDAIYKTLCTLKELQPPPQKKEEEPAERKFTIFLADTSDSLRTIRRRMASELEQNGIRVVSGLPPPYEAAPHEEKAIKEITEADLSVHLLDNLPGREIEDLDSVSYPRRQAELALEHAKSQIVWVPHSLDVQLVDDEPYRGFLDRLENGGRAESAYSFIRESPSSITREILEKVEQLKSGPPAVQDFSAALVDTHFKDQLHALQLSQFLIGKNVQPYINPEEDDPRKNLKIFEERLKQVNRLIVIFGQVAEEWVLERLGAALQIAIVERCPLKACGIYFAPPRTKSAATSFNLGFLPVYTFDSSDINNPRAFQPFIENIS